MATKVGEVTIKKVIRFVNECAICESALDADPYRLELEGGGQILLCDACGIHFIRLFNIKIEKE